MLFVQPKKDGAANTTAKKKKGKSGFRAVNDWLHLWLGISSGLIIVIISLTGCIYAFQEEIGNLTQDYRHVQPQQKTYMLPSQLHAIAKKAAFGSRANSAGNHIYGIEFIAKNKAAVASYTDAVKGYTMMYLNPYDGTVLKIKPLNEDFFRIVLAGHFYLWLPEAVGQPVIAISVLIFVILLITGLVMWWPKNLRKHNRDKSFKVKWAASFKRINYDLHNVLGFYVLLIALALAVTGLVWGFQWFDKSYYWALSGGKTAPEYAEVLSDSTKVNTYTIALPEDKIWQQQYPQYEKLEGSTYIGFADEKGAYSFGYNSRPGTYYKNNVRYFDKHTLQEIKSSNLYDLDYSTLSTGQKIYRMNYDIHVGAVLGLPGKCIAFFASLICASLPITGFIVWWGKRKKKAGSPKKPSLS